MWPTPRLVHVLQHVIYINVWIFAQYFKVPWPFRLGQQNVHGDGRFHADKLPRPPVLWGRCDIADWEILVPTQFIPRPPLGRIPFQVLDGADFA